MRLSYLANALGLILIYIGIVTLIPIAVALIYQDYSSIIPFLTASFISVSIGLALKYTVKGSNAESLNDIKKAEALCIVACSWVVFGIMASIPYLFYGISPLNALFESVSGITTTGATILTHYDYPKAMFFWRSFTQWLGGLGIIVLFIAVLPQFAVAGRQMFFAEAPGPTEDKITPRIRNTASALWKIYIWLTIAEIILLIAAGMPAFDAVCNSFSTLAAGGFSPNPESIMGYHSRFIDWIVIIFMFLAGSSFILLFKVISQKKPMLFFKNEEFKLYFSIVLILSVLISIALFTNHQYNLFESITAAVYQVTSLTTSTGSASVDFANWGFSAKILLYIAMFTSCCASSTGGGVKITRWLLVFKSMKSELIRILHPNAIVNVKVDNNIIPRDVLGQIVVFVFFYISIFAITSILISILEHNSTIGLTSSITALGNIGPGFGKLVGPMSNFDGIHWVSKTTMIINMLVGRLELIPFLVMFQRDFWTIKDN